VGVTAANSDTVGAGAAAVSAAATTDTNVSIWIAAAGAGFFGGVEGYRNHRLGGFPCWCSVFHRSGSRLQHNKKSEGRGWCLWRKSTRLLSTFVRMSSRRRKYIILTTALMQWYLSLLSFFLSFGITSSTSSSSCFFSCSSFDFSRTRQLLRLGSSYTTRECFVVSFKEVYCTVAVLVAANFINTLI